MSLDSPESETSLNHPNHVPHQVLITKLLLWYANKDADHFQDIKTQFTRFFEQYSTHVHENYLEYFMLALVLKQLFVTFAPLLLSFYKKCAEVQFEKEIWEEENIENEKLSKSGKSEFYQDSIVNKLYRSWSRSWLPKQALFCQKQVGKNSLEKVKISKNQELEKTMFVIHYLQNQYHGIQCYMLEFDYVLVPLLLVINAESNVQLTTTDTIRLFLTLCSHFLTFLNRNQFLRNTVWTAIQISNIHFLIQLSTYLTYPYQFYFFFTLTISQGYRVLSEANRLLVKIAAWKELTSITDLLMSVEDQSSESVPLEVFVTSAFLFLTIGNVKFVNILVLGSFSVLRVFKLVSVFTGLRRTMIPRVLDFWSFVVLAGFAVFGARKKWFSKNELESVSSRVVFHSLVVLAGFYTMKTVKSLFTKDASKEEEGTNERVTNEEVAKSSKTLKKSSFKAKNQKKAIQKQASDDAKVQDSKTNEILRKSELKALEKLISSYQTKMAVQNCFTKILLFTVASSIGDFSKIPEIVIQATIICQIATFISQLAIPNSKLVKFFEILSMGTIATILAFSRTASFHYRHSEYIYELDFDGYTKSYEQRMEDTLGPV